MTATMQQSCGKVTKNYYY